MPRSSNSNGFYKSKLFNFINRQSHKLSDRWNIRWRHLQVGAKWGLQILLYPIYLVLQAGRIAQYQLQQKLESEQKSIGSQTSQTNDFSAVVPTLRENDSPVLVPVRLFLQLMSWVQTSPVAIAANLFEESNLVGTSANENYPAAKTQFRSSTQVSTNLYSQPSKLALDDDNITSAQSKRVVPEVQIVTPLNSNNSKLQELKKQLQKQANTSQDRTFKSTPISPEFTKTERASNKTFIKSAIDYLETKVQEPLSVASDSSSAIVLATKERKIIPLIKQYSAALTVKLVTNLSYGLETAAQTVKTGLKVSQENLTSKEAIEANSEKIKVLFQTSIDYLLDKFEQNTARLQPQNDRTVGLIAPANVDSASPQIVESPQQETSVTSAEDIQLSLSNLFKDNELDSTPREAISQELTSLQTSSSSEPALEKRFQSTLKLKSTLLGGIQRYLLEQQESQSSSSPQPVTSDLEESVHLVSEMDNPSSDSVEVNLSPTEDTTIESAPNWVETNATPIGYVQHPLEIVLEWLDQIMVRIEELATIAWRWVREKLRKVMSKN